MTENPRCRILPRRFCPQNTPKSPISHPCRPESEFSWTLWREIEIEIVPRRIFSVAPQRQLRIISAAELMPRILRRQIITLSRIPGQRFSHDDFRHSSVIRIWYRNNSLRTSWHNLPSHSPVFCRFSAFFRKQRQAHRIPDGESQTFKIIYQHHFLLFFISELQLKNHTTNHRCRKRR